MGNEAKSKQPSHQSMQGAGSDGGDVGKKTVTPQDSAAGEQPTQGYRTTFDRDNVRLPWSSPSSGSATDRMAERYDALDENWHQEREAVADPTGAHILDGGSGPDTALDGKHAGDAGYAARLGKAGTVQAREGMAKGDYGVAAPLVEPFKLPLDRGIAEQAQWIAKKEAEKEDKQYVHSFKRDFLTLGLTQTQKDPTWVTVEKANSITLAGAQLAMLERHMFEQDRWVNAYNAWAPIANEAHMARADLIESAALMGFDLGRTEDMVKFIEGIEHGLDNAAELVDANIGGPHAQTSVTHQQDFKGDVPPEPSIDGGSMESLLGKLREKYDAVNTAHMTVYANLLGARTDILEQSKFAKESKVAEINATIQFFTDMAGTVQGGVKSANVAPAKADAKLNQYMGEWRARRYENKAVEASNAGHHAQSRFDVGRAESTRATSQSVDAQGGGAPSIAGLVGALTSMHFEGELHTLNGQILSLKKGIAATNATQKLAESEAALQVYANARRQLAEVAKQLTTQKMAERERQYLKTGDTLDRYAIAHASQLKGRKAALKPKDAKHEVYSSLMLMVAKIRAYTSLADSARNMFPYDKFVRQALDLASERRNPMAAQEVQRAPKSVYWQPPSVPKLGRDEDRVWETIDSSYATAFGFSERGRIQFVGIEEKVAKLLQKMKGVESKTNDVAENPY